MNQLKVGAILSYLSLLLTILITLVYTPIMIRLLGQSEYGLYSMIGSISAYLSIMDLGLGNAIIRYISKNRVEGNSTKEAKLNGLFFILYTIIGLITVIIGFILVNTVDVIFKASLLSSELEKARLMIIIITVNFAISFPLSIFGSIMQAYEKFIIIKFLNIVRILIIPIITLPLLFFGFGSVTMVLLSSIINVVLLLFNIVYCFKRLDISLYFGELDFGQLKEILTYSFFIFLGIIVDQINWNTGQVILGIVAGTSSVAIYAIAMQFIRLYLQFSTSISGLFLPKITMMVANNATNNDLTSMMIKFSRIQYVVLSFILSGFILFGSPFIKLWAGEVYSNAYYISIIVMIPITIPLIQNICLSILQAKNLQGFRSVVLVIIAILNLIISFPLGSHYGGVGVAWGTGISYLIGNIFIMNVYYHIRIKINMIAFWKNIFQLTLPTVISIIIGFYFSTFIQNTIIFLVIKILLFSIVFIVLMWILGFNDYEKKIVLQLLRFARVNKKNDKINLN